MTNDSLNFSGIEHVVFDWNGTLIDDIDLAVFAVNRCGEHYDVAPINADLYRARFDFPIAGFYAALGFDLDRVPFPTIVQRYLEHFDAHVAECPLQPYVIEFLDAAMRAGIGVSILSASHCDVLVQTLKAKGLYDRFEHVVGLSHNQATSKTAEALVLQQTLGTPASRTLFIGDTLHDFDVACAVGWSPVLVSTGHQDIERLRISGAPLFQNLGELLEHFAPAHAVQTETGSA
ncbi:HAD family hydrolase [Pseudomonas viridiflava]|uniref:phosphoglycolate phosphatase n=2 Tax=Pseudomonas viridiflava TaxID=33069 RepID=A0A1Y6JPJ9_PSEVI|nr:HAD family hydrolase [Pseudomonas viridiflava]SMS11071.1 phosphoglycolate phosphatase [Pseudomonas viridiflava]VVO02356.1 Phosphoglycolate phosphatase [Pseudomonas fluorescens]